MDADAGVVHQYVDPPNSAVTVASNAYVAAAVTSASTASAPGLAGDGLGAGRRRGR